MPTCTMPLRCRRSRTSITRPAGAPRSPLRKTVSSGRPASRSLMRSASSESCTRASRRYTCPSRLIDSTIGSCTLRGRLRASARGKATWMPWWSIGVATMKMISSTSITSTSGVTLMSPITSSCSSRRWKAMGVPVRSGEVPLRQVEELHHEVFDACPQLAAAVSEVVVGDERRDRGAQPGGGVDQRLGDAGRDRDDRSRAGAADVFEGHHDPPDGAEQTDERRCRGGGGQERRPARHVAQLDAGRPLEGALERRQRRDAIAAPLARRIDLLGALGLAVDLGVTCLEDADQRRVAQAVGERVHLAESVAAVEGLEELAALPGGAPHLPGLAEDDRPRDQGEERQQGEDGLGDRAGFTEEVEQPLLFQRSGGLQK